MDIGDLFYAIKKVIISLNSKLILKEKKTIMYAGGR